MKQPHLKLLLTGAIALLLSHPPKAFAAGTAAGTDVDSSATVSFSVSGVPQPDVVGATTFKVDKKINVTVAELGGSYTDVLPGATQKILTFTVTNNSNATQDFFLTVLNQVSTTSDPFGGTDNFDTLGVPAPQAFVDSNSNGLFDSGTDPTYLDNLPADASVTVLVQADMPSGLLNGDIAVVTLKVEARDLSGTEASPGAPLTETGGADDPAVVDIVFGDLAGSDDGLRDAIHSARDAYRVQTAALSVIKSSRIISDPVNGTTNPKRIPGAVIEYCIEVTNSGSVSATSVTITNDLSTEPVTFQSGSIMTESSLCTLEDGAAEDDDATDSFAGDETPNGGNFTDPNVTITFDSVPASTTRRAQYRVTID